MICKGPLKHTHTHTHTHIHTHTPHTTHTTHTNTFTVLKPKEIRRSIYQSPEGDRNIEKAAYREGSSKMLLTIKGKLTKRNHLI